jgi:hypothetical protein
MYYTVEEMTNALKQAKDNINNRTSKVDKFTWGYNDCFCFLIEYDKALKGKKSKAEKLKIEYNNPKEYLLGLKRQGFTLKSFAEYCNYEIRPDLRPQYGDIGYMDGSAVIAENGHWVTTDEDNSGIKQGSRYMFLDRRLNLLARPLRS